MEYDNINGKVNDAINHNDNGTIKDTKMVLLITSMVPSMVLSIILLMIVSIMILKLYYQ